MPQAEWRQTLDVIRDFTHVFIDHFVRIVEQSVIYRRNIAAQAVNVADRSMLLSAPLGTDLFGGQWQAAVEHRPQETFS